MDTTRLSCRVWTWKRRSTWPTLKRYRWVHDHVQAALLTETQDVQGSVRFENCGTEFRSIRDASVKLEWKLQFCGRAWPNTCHGESKRDGRSEDGTLLSEDNTTASTCYDAWCDRTNIDCSVTIRRYWYGWGIYIIQEKLDSDMESKSESLSWTSTLQTEEKDDNRKYTAKSQRIKWRRMICRRWPKIVEKIWTTLKWTACDGEIPNKRTFRSLLRWRTSSWMRKRSAWNAEQRPNERDKMEAQIRLPQQRSTLKHPDVQVNGEKKKTGPQGKRDDHLRENDEATDAPDTLCHGSEEKKVVINKMFFSLKKIKYKKKKTLKQVSSWKRNR